MTIRVRRDTATNWSTTNPVLADGQPGYEKGTGKLKFGDGSTAWNSLAYFSAGGGGGSGTVTSVALTAPSGLTVTGSPITSAGTLAITTTLSGYVKGNGSGFTAAATVPAADLSGTIAAAQMPAHTGDVTSTAGSVATTIAAGAVSLTKMANLAANSLIGNNTGSAATPLALTGAQVKAMLAIAPADISGLAAIATSGSAADLVAGTIPASRMPAHTGDVTSSAGAVALTIANSAVTLAKMADVATASVFYRKTAGTGAPEVQTLATLKTDLGLSGTNTGDQTSVTGNAGTATALQTGRTISITGDITYTSPAFDGSANVTAAGTLATVNSNVGSFGSSSSVPVITVNAKGLITAISTAAVSGGGGGLSIGLDIALSQCALTL